MNNDFVNYYKTVEEHAKDLVDEVYDELVEELKEAHHGLKLATFLSWKEREISEYNNGLYISLREAVEILEQSNRLVQDSSLYVNSGDCREQVQSMAYWTYKTDLEAEFLIAIRLRLDEDLIEFKNELDNLETQMEELDDLVTEKEEEISDIELDLDEMEDNNLKKDVVKKLHKLQADVESLKDEEEKFEHEIQELQNLIDNIENILKEK